MARWLRALPALIEDLDLGPSPHMAELITISSVLDSTASSDLQAPGMHVMHIHTCNQNTHAHKIEIAIKKDLKKDFLYIDCA